MGHAGDGALPAQLPGVDGPGDPGRGVAAPAPPRRGRAPARQTLGPAERRRSVVGAADPHPAMPRAEHRLARSIRARRAPRRRGGAPSGWLAKISGPGGYSGASRSPGRGVTSRRACRQGARPVSSAKRCGARNRNHPDNDIDNDNNGLRVVLAHRSHLARRGSRRRTPRRQAIHCERARQRPGSSSRRTRAAPPGKSWMPPPCGRHKRPAERHLSATEWVTP